eukprot:gene24574-10185_t
MAHAASTVAFAFPATTKEPPPTATTSQQSQLDSALPLRQYHDSSLDVLATLSSTSSADFAPSTFQETLQALGEAGGKNIGNLVNSSKIGSINLAEWGFKVQEAVDKMMHEIYSCEIKARPNQTKQSQHATD